MKRNQLDEPNQPAYRRGTAPITVSMVYCLSSIHLDVLFLRSSSPTKEYKVATSYVSIKGKSYSWATYHLNHKDWFKSTIRVTNGAYADNQKTTDGVLVDLTPPFLDYIFDGKVCDYHFHLEFDVHCFC